MFPALRVVVLPKDTIPSPTLVKRQDPILATMLERCPHPANNVLEESFLQAMNRNARKPRRANHGARPCSRVARRAKKREHGNRRR